MNPVLRTHLLCSLWFVTACGGLVEVTPNAITSVGGETGIPSTTGGTGATTGGAPALVSTAPSTVVDAGAPVTPVCARPSWILAESMRNARDLGGIPLAGTTSVPCRKFYRGPKLSSLAERGCAEFDSLGFRTVIDLRVSSERQSYPEAACVSNQANIVEAPLPIPYNVSPTDYLTVLNTMPSIALVLDILADDTAYPVYIHCTYGRDRTGVLSAVILSLLGASRDEIMSDYMLSELAGVGAYPDSLSAVLDEIERHGGIDAYLSGAGVSAKTLVAVRHHLTSPALQ